MTTIVEFLTQRLDEREAAARAVCPPGRPMEQGRYLAWLKTGETLGDHSGGVISYNVTSDALDHIVLNDPAYVLADITAKRAILEQYTKEAWVMEQGHHTAWTEAGQAARESVLRLLALPFAQHPDYDQRWRPA